MLLFAKPIYNGLNTLLINCLLKEREYEGEILYNGVDIAEKRQEILSQVAYVSDKCFYPEDLTCNQVKYFVRKFYRQSWDEQCFINLCERFEINCTNKIKQLSSGTKTKLDIALGLSKSTDFFILDEPTSGLDPIVRIEVLQYLTCLFH